MRHLKRTLLVLAALGLLALAVVGLLPSPVPVELAAVARGPLRVRVEAAGRTRVRERFVVSAPVSGHLERVALRAGDPVEAGQELAWVLPAAPPPLDARTRAEASARVAAASSGEAEARAGVERAGAALAQARVEVGRSLRLAENGAVSAQALQQAEYEVTAREKDLALAERGVERAAREVAAARAALLGAEPAPSGRGERVPVRAPVAGRVLRVSRESEGPVAAGAPLLEVGDPRALEAVLDLLTAQAVRVQPGASAELDRWGGAGPLPARVSAIEPSGFTKVSALGVEEQRVNVLLEPPEGECWEPLGDGFHVEGRILVYERPDALKLPAGALFRRGGEWAAFVVEGGKATARTLKAGESDGREVEILSGLKEGERVVLHPSDKVTEGVSVTPL